MSYTRWKCRFCDQDVTYNGVATAAHYKKHMRALGLKPDSNKAMEAALQKAVKDGRWPIKEAANGQA